MLCTLFCFYFEKRKMEFFVFSKGQIKHTHVSNKFFKTRVAAIVVLLWKD